MMNINARTHWRIEYCNQVELGTRQPDPNIPSSDVAGTANDAGKKIANNVVADGHAQVDLTASTFGDPNDITLDASR